jgi:hypothetical protein
MLLLSWRCSWGKTLGKVGTMLLTGAALSQPPMPSGSILAAGAPLSPALTQPAEVAVDIGTKQANSEAEPPAVPTLPASVPAAIGPEEAGIVGLTPGPADDVGMGHLRPSNVTSLLGSNWRSSPILYARWLRSVALPIIDSPKVIGLWLLMGSNDQLFRRR